MILSLLLLTLIGPILGVSSSARSSPSDLADIYDRLQHPLTPEEEEFSLLNSGLQTSHGGVADRSIAVEPISSTDKHESSIHLPDSPSQFRGNSLLHPPLSRLDSKYMAHSFSTSRSEPTTQEKHMLMVHPPEERVNNREPPGTYSHFNSEIAHNALGSQSRSSPWMPDYLTPTIYDDRLQTPMSESETAIWADSQSHPASEPESIPEDKHVVMIHPPERITNRQGPRDNSHPESESREARDDHIELRLASLESELSRQHNLARQGRLNRSQRWLRFPTSEEENEAMLRPVRTRQPSSLEERTRNWDIQEEDSHISAPLLVFTTFIISFCFILHELVKN
ncbi:hypothetical protein MJO28_006886 [Puccinia striiformis f. sp. tritici]|uniref:Uncharacterized protein n=1 Tax=Puccinia striiformis f. sp. tritici TaxID=168172 RepID=A0ACC0EEE6_9BASI|nr:hypothetical protein MJO28_006886 [Puccinia striiformis f. sp. tritici]KAI9630386.1 hypothetical protein KEM48_014112 [Puccinia striiformis f. sp. tritici PST-130]